MSEGPGVIFVVLSVHTTASGSAGPWLSILIFSTLVVSGVHWQSENIITIDNFLNRLVPNYRCPKGMLCMVGCLVGMIFVKRSGVYWFEMFDTLVGPCTLLVLLIIVCCLVQVLCCKKRNSPETIEMLQRKFQIWYKTVRLAVPVLLTILLMWYVGDCVVHKPAYRLWGINQGHFMYYPWYSVLLAGLVIVACLSPVFGLAALNYLGLYTIKHSKNLKDKNQKSPSCRSVIITSPKYVMVGDHGKIKVKGCELQHRRN